jgi:hypothetical protein
MSEEEILEGNKLIAEFMGYKYINPKDSCDRWGWYLNGDNSTSINYLKELKYHSSWDCLMPVVEKIESILSISDEDYYSITIRRDECILNNGYSDIIKHSLPNQSKIESIYKVVIEFINFNV